MDAPRCGCSTVCPYGGYRGVVTDGSGRSHPVDIHFPIRLSRVRTIVSVSCRLQSMYQPVESRRGERSHPCGRLLSFVCPLAPDFHTFGWKKVQGDFLCLPVGKGICPIDLCNHETRRPGDERYGRTEAKAVGRLRDMMRTDGGYPYFVVLKNNNFYFMRSHIPDYPCKGQMTRDRFMCCEIVSYE